MSSNPIGPQKSKMQVQANQKKENDQDLEGPSEMETTEFNDEELIDHTLLNKVTSRKSSISNTQDFVVPTIKPIEKKSVE